MALESNIEYQTQEQPQPAIQRIDTGFYAPEKVDSKWLFDYDYIWLQFEAHMKGGTLYRNPKTETWFFEREEGTFPFMNDRGIKDIMALLRANVNIISGSSWLTEDRVMVLCLDMANALLKMLQNNRLDYDLSESKMQVVVETFMNAYELNLRKSVGGKALIYSMQSEKVMIHRDDTPKQGTGLLGTVARKVFG